MSRPALTPDATHPITITPTPGRVVVRSGDTVVADTTDALTLQESSYRAVQYVPLADVDPAVLQRTAHATHCPYKGDAAYYSVVAGGREIANAVWEYQEPYAAVAPIKDHVAFYADKVSIEVG